MWIPFLFLIGIISIVLIARYNEDDRLFWKLLLSFVFAFAATTVCYKITGLGNKSMENLTEQVYPTQVPTGALDISNPSVNAFGEVTIMDVTGPVPVSKDNTPALCKTSPTFDEVYGHDRDQPPRVLNSENKVDSILDAFEIDSS